MRKTKIIATLGPASRDETTLTHMIENGMNVVRLNFSHQDHNFHAENIALIKRLREKTGVPLAILLDTKGPEIRTGTVENGEAVLNVGDSFTLTERDIIGDSYEVSVKSGLPTDKLTTGTRILIDDGSIELSVCDVQGTDVHCTVKTGGVLGNTRGVNIPDVEIPLPFLSERDKEDLLFGIEQGVDLIAASFVRTAEDVSQLKNFLVEHGGEDIKVIAKIENRFGIRNFDEILSVSDGIMVARGDMGVEIPYEQLPGIQKKLIAKCYKSGKMAITATQMLESMIKNRHPTRAEISDVANAVFDSSSAVMLSGETAIGCDPAEVVATMSRICETAESDARMLRSYDFLGTPGEHGLITDAVCDAAVITAKDLDASAILAVTKSGDTARFTSKYRPDCLIVGATDNIKTYHQLSVHWGVKPMLTESKTDTDSLFAHVTQRALDEGILKSGEIAVITAGSPVGISGRTNQLRIVEA